jgi:pilus assembly protein Flp/PilA
MGKAARSFAVSDARGGHSADSDAARSLVTAFLQDERGATAIEYAIIAAGVAVTIVTAISALSVNVKTMFNSIAAAF